MTPQPVASTPKDIAPQRAAPPLPAIAAAFDELLTIGLPSSNRAQSAKADQTQPNGRPKSKNDGDNTNAGALAAVPVPAPQLLPAITAVTSSGETKVAAPAAPATSAAKAADALAMGAAANASNGAGGNGNGAKLPPGAAELEARIVAAAPNYLSQPNAALSGLWHHVGENAKPAATGQPAFTDAPSDGAPAPQAQAGSRAKDVAAFAKDLSLQSASAPGIESAQATAADPGKASTAAVGAADTSGAISVALPGATEPQIATAQAPAANPALPSPAQIPAAWEQVAVNLRQAAQNGSDRIEIQLKPASLGAIVVKLDLTHDGRATAVISADRSDTLNLLRQDSDALAQSLRDAGLQADSGSLSFNLRGDPQSFAQGSAPMTTSAGRIDDPAAASSARIETTRYRQHAGALDIEV